MSESESSKTTMRCHYEVMEVPMNAKEEEIKKQYKKLALKWHPDRNHGQEELATKNFKEISAAYSVLSDPQERKWYDDHREAILRGGDGTKGDSDGQAINIFKYFNSSCYSGPEDGIYGFYGVYKGVFERIDLQEINGQTGTAAAAAPLFGDSKSAIADVLRFYSYWENFATKLSFSWEDKYNVLDAPNRQTRRAMEKENQKLRDTVRKEYTAEVRSLAAFVKKRDQRYLQYEAEVQQRRLEEETKKVVAKAEAELRRKEAREARLAAEQYTPEELEARETERKRAFLLADNDSDDEDDDDNYYTEEELQAKLREMKLSENSSNNSSGNSKKGKKNQNISVFTNVENNQEGVEPSNESTTVENEVNDDEENEDDDEEGQVLFGCEICSKTFKSEAQLNQHLASKVHRKKAQELQKKSKSKK